jgi:hypothetical protein
MNKTKKILIRIVLPALAGLIILLLILLPYGLKKYINDH